MKLLRKKPKKREKILFAIMLGVMGLTALKSCIWADIRAIRVMKTEIAQVKQPSLTLPAPVENKKKWIGTSNAVQEAPEMLLNSYELHNVRMTKNQFSPVIFEQDRQKRAVNLIVEGDYQALERYMNYLENMPAPLVVYSFSIQKSATDPDVLSLELSGDFYGTN